MSSPLSRGSDPVSPSPRRRGPRERLGGLRERLRAIQPDAAGGVLMLVGTVAALVWANSPAGGSYAALISSEPTAWLGGDGGVRGSLASLTLGHWVEYGLLAIFFFSVGLELKGERAYGRLHDPRVAALPALCAIGGMVVPAGLYLAVVFGFGRGDLSAGWAIPTNTEVAFAAAILTAVSRGRAGAARVFLMTLAVIDDVLGILVIALVYAGSLSFLSLLLAVAAVGLFAWLVRRPWARAWMLAPVACLAWALTVDSGIHPTIAGVALGLVVPATRVGAEPRPRLETYARASSAWSNLVVLPLFALVAAGVDVVGPSSPPGGLGAIASHPAFLGVVVGLVVGKPLGILATAGVLARWTPLRFDAGLTRRDLVTVSILGGFGFTVSLLIAGIAFTAPADQRAARLGVLVGSATASALAALAARLPSPREGVAGRDSVTLDSP